MAPESSVSTLLRDKWSSGYLPIISGIGWPGGQIDWIRVFFSRDSGRSLLERGNSSQVSLSQLEREGELGWAQIGQLCEAGAPVQQYRAVAGEGGLGGDGFIALLGAQNGELVWFAFFEASNPFESLHFENDTLVARTNLGDEWRFPIGAPASFTIKHVLAV